MKATHVPVIFLILWLSTLTMGTKLCYRAATLGKDYRGSVSETWSGYKCQRWDSQRPHKHSIGKNLYGNACRNPKGDGDSPWCYTTNPKKRWDYCRIPECEKSCVRRGDSGESYEGNVSVTRSGITCQNWSSQYPHKHGKKHLSAAGNSCRNPDGEAAPWCYTTDPKIRWAYCDVPDCYLD